jgi:hypothetical protein
MRVFPQGLDPRDSEQSKQLRLAYEEWQENPSLAGRQRAWIMHVLTQALGYPQQLLAEGQSLPPGLTAAMAEYGETLRPELVLLGPPGSELAGKPQLLISIYSTEQSLDKPVAGKHWKATPATRTMELLHAADVALGLVTNGEQWMLVFAPRGDTTGFTTWYASLWIDEPITLRAFQSLLSTRRFFGVAASDALLAILKESAQDQQEVTNQLGEQVRDAVEVLIQAFDQLDQGSGRRLLDGVDEKSLYDAALTVMMRLVFLFSAEERGLLHLGKPIYDDNYAVSTLREQLQEVADRYGEEVLERRHDAWARLLAVFRAVHGGVSHQDLMLPAYGGSLFDPDRYPFLEGRPQGSSWQTKSAEPLRINNRVVLHLLKSLQMLQVKVPGGGPAEARRISFRALDIEQIGHIYEGLLDHTAIRAKEVVLGLAASRKKPVASMSLSELEALHQQDESKLIETLEEATDRSAKALEKALKKGDGEEDSHKILIACGQDQKLVDRVRVFSGLLRLDSFERPVVVLPGSIYVGQGSARRSTGTHYTPRSLTEPVVQYTLEPLVYKGPAEGLPKEQWRLKTPKEILELKICDMAMGSGAFLVQVCRYLSERLVEAWENLEKDHPGEVLITPEGQFSQGEPSERLIPKEAAERLAIARRLVADRCIYGVDINPMAVEMAKLSIWLITVDKSRPFTFLDHALKGGDSLLGLRSLKQLETFSLRSDSSKQIGFSTMNLWRHIEEAKKKRESLEAMPSDRPEQIAAKVALHAAAEDAVAKLNAAADVLVAVELKGTKGNAYEAEREAAAGEMLAYWVKGLPELQSYARQLRGESRYLHWALAFPEIIGGGGFDAILGNPPYMWGQRISTRLGDAYFQGLRQLYNQVKGVADLIAYFFIRGVELLSDTGCLGLVATDTLHRGDTRESSLDVVLANGCTVYRATTDRDWPGAATVKYCTVNLTRRIFKGVAFLDDVAVESIGSHLDSRVNADTTGDTTYRLELSIPSYVGSYIYGDGFLLTHDEAVEIIGLSPISSSVIKPYLIGDDVLGDPLCQPSRSVIDFGAMTEDEARKCDSCYERIKQTVYPVRQSQKRASRKKYWWHYGEKATELYKAIQPLGTVIVHPYVSTYLCFALVPSKYIYASPMVVIISDDYRTFCLLQNGLHEIWITTFCSRLGSGIRYTTSDGLSKYPLPVGITFDEEMRRLAKSYLDVRTGIAQSRQEGLTRIYKLFHNPCENSEDLARLRMLQVAMDKVVATAYGWNDLDLGHGFYETKQGGRFTISEPARRTVLDRLLALNHQRYEEEDKAGLHDKKAKGSGKRNSSNSKLEKNTAQSALY